MDIAGPSLMADVVTLKVRADIVKDDITDLLERWLADAKEGVLTGLVVVATTSDDMIRIAIPASDEIPSLLSGVLCAQKRLLEVFEED